MRKANANMMPEVMMRIVIGVAILKSSLKMSRRPFTESLPSLAAKKGAPRRAVELNHEGSVFVG